MSGTTFKEVTWWKEPDFLDHCRTHPVPAHLRVFLSTDGTVVNALRALLLEPVVLEKVEHREVDLTEEEADFFRQPRGKTRGILREIWLSQSNSRNNSRWVYALSFYPRSDLSPTFHQEMVRSGLPLGALIETRGLSTRRDHLEICTLRHPQTAREMGYPEEAPLWGRRYRLNILGEASVSIFEVFSPRLNDPAHFSAR